MDRLRPRLLDQLRDRIRLKHYSIRTEEAYSEWVRRVVLFHGKRHPRELGHTEVEAFLTHLAVAGRVAASTQNQAKSALLFLYKEVLGLELPWLSGVQSAKRPARLPVVLTRDEVRTVLAHTSGTSGLILRLLYGSGMRILEVLRLRVKDVDFERREILVRDGKSARDRVTMLPAGLVPTLLDHLVRVHNLQREDLAQGYGTVHLPFALARKYPNAAREWGWQYVFPTRGRSVDPRSGGSAVIMPGTSRRNAHCVPPFGKPASRNRPRPIPSATRLRRTSSRTATTSARCRSCSVIATSRRHRSTRMF